MEEKGKGWRRKEKDGRGLKRMEEGKGWRRIDKREVNGRGGGRIKKGEKKSDGE